MSEPWRVRLAASAEADLLDIAAWTAEHFGSRQAALYIETVTQAIEALHEGPTSWGSRRGTTSRPAFAPCMWRGRAERAVTSSCSGPGAGH